MRGVMGNLLEKMCVKQSTRVGPQLFKSWVGFSISSVSCAQHTAPKHRALVSITVENAFRSDWEQVQILRTKNKLHCLLVYN